MPAADWANLQAGLEAEEKPLSLRQNPYKRTNLPWAEQLQPLPWSAEAYYLLERPNFALDPLWHAGAYYVQEASSMLLAQMIRQHLPQKENLAALDLSAAPGGKTTLLAAQLPPDAILLANMRHSASRQNEILDQIIGCLAPEGVLVYSICTFNRYENEAQIERLLAEREDLELLRLALDESWGFIESNLGYRAYPGRVSGEGFFLSVIRRKAGRAKKLKAPKKPSFKAVKELDNWAKKLDTVWGLDFWLRGEEIVAFPKVHKKLGEQLARSLYLLQAGANLLEQKGAKYRPMASSGQSLAWAKSAFPSIELEKEAALNYLRGEVLSLENMPKGWFQLHYQGLPLGWAKGLLGGRMNNYYPKHWRLRQR
ncbi:NOL1/NOP2/sun family protein [Saprospira grandis DSM 2844]|uniref:NOL1/NOP2/sun family protein n=1 Tax=Saprospira grandis DSM 2844 TaxID=694433 RepID=J0P496_9BACT|nr:RNA methyltransferase [Saprospira grandis]EJF54664.1 NOL1/NOP2/sun family protein [Saprospira grandis DSM 2844]